MLDEAFDIMQRGGAFMWPILIVSLVSIAFIVERAYVLWIAYRLNVDGFVTQVLDLVEQQKFSHALEACSTQAGHPLATVVRAGIMKASGSEREIQRAMEAAALRVYPLVTRRTSYLAMLANVATLLGLLGTVLGLVEAFRGVAEADAATKQEILAKGIAVAMNTTAFGLVTAIPALIAYAVLYNRQSFVLSQIESRATEVLSFLAEKSRLAARRVG